MTLEIPEKIAKEEWEKLPDTQKPIFRQAEGDPNFYEYAVPQMFNSMRNAKEEREREKQARETAEAQAAQFKKFGDPAKIEDLLAREEMLKDSTKTMEEAMSKAKREADERYNGLISDLKKENQTLLSSRCQDHQNNIVNSLIANSGVEKDYEEEVRLALGKRLKTELRDGVPHTFVVSDENPNELAKDPDTFDPMSPERYFQQYRQRKSRFFKGDTEGSGSGFTPGRGGRSDMFDADPLTWDWQTKRDFFASMGANADAAYTKKLQAWDKKRSAEKRKAS
jgi:hypothetical protein